MKQRFNKKIFTASLFFRDIGYLIWNLPKFLAIRKNIDISNIFIEKIMTVTTAVNGCVYCAWLHAKKAIESGISDEEIKNMMKLQFQADSTEFELIGLLYAQHYAETNRKPEPEMTEKLFNYYGEPTYSQIILLIRQINFGNLYGNTWDAVMSRFKGIPSPNSNIIFEIFYFLLNFAIFIPLTIIMKLEKNKSMSVKFLNRSIWQRLFGIPETKEPKKKNSWTYHSGELIVHLDRLPELKEPGSAVRFEGGGLPVRVLVVFDEGDQFHAFHNKCTHFGHRRLDYVRGTNTIQCCSINKSTYTFAGKKIHGPNPKPVDTYPVKKDGDNLYIKLS